MNQLKISLKVSSSATPAWEEPILTEDIAPMLENVASTMVGALGEPELDATIKGSSSGIVVEVKTEDGESTTVAAVLAKLVGDRTYPIHTPGVLGALFPLFYPNGIEARVIIKAQIVDVEGTNLGTRT